MDLVRRLLEAELPVLLNTFISSATLNFCVFLALQCVMRTKPQLYPLLLNKMCKRASNYILGVTPCNLVLKIQKNPLHLPNTLMTEAAVSSEVSVYNY